MTKYVVSLQKEYSQESMWIGEYDTLEEAMKEWPSNSWRQYKKKWTTLNSTRKIPCSIYNHHCDPPIMLDVYPRLEIVEHEVDISGNYIAS